MDSVSVMIRANFLTPEDRLELERCVRRQREDRAAGECDFAFG